MHADGFYCSPVVTTLIVRVLTSSCMFVGRCRALLSGASIGTRSPWYVLDLQHRRDALASDLSCFGFPCRACEGPHCVITGIQAAFNLPDI